MVNNNLKKFSAFLLVICFIFCLYGKAEAAEVYTAEARGYYKHPVTGEIEDSGNNPGIGDGMVSNTVYGLALIEKDDNGKLYATVRLNLRDKIENIKFWVQNRGDNGFAPVSSEETANTGPTGDFRFEIPNTECVVRSSFFVGPMSRDVIFYIDFSSLESGSGDFKVMINVSGDTSTNRQNDRTGEVTAPTQASVRSSSGNANSSGNSSNSSPNNTSRNTNKNSKNTNKNINTGQKLSQKNKKIDLPHGQGVVGNNGEKNDSANKKINQSDLGYEHGLLTNKDFDDSQTLFGTTQEDESNHPWGPFTKAVFTIVIVIIGILFSIFLLGGGSVAFLYHYKKRNNLAIEEILSSANSKSVAKKNVDNWNGKYRVNKDGGANV